MLHGNSKDRRRPHIRMQFSTIFDQQDDEYCNTIKTEKLWEMSTSQSQAFFSCRHRDLDFLSTHLDGITTETYTAEIAKKTEDRGDCCMMSICEWGHARLEYEEDVSYFDDQDRMDFIGEYLQGQ